MIKKSLCFAPASEKAVFFLTAQYQCTEPAAPFFFSAAVPDNCRSPEKRYIDETELRKHTVMSEFWTNNWQSILTYGTCLFMIAGFLLIFFWIIPPGKDESDDRGE